MQFGVVDLEAPIEEQVAAMRAACEDLGFFRIPLASVPRVVADGAWDAARDFFALPEAQKREIEFPHAGYPYGYSPFRFETLGRSIDDAAALPDLKESLSVGPDCGLASLEAGRLAGGEEWIRQPSLWPVAAAHLRPAWTAYYRALSDVAAQLLSVMARVLDLEPTHFDSLIDRPITSMRAIHYPAADDDRGDTDDRSLRAGAHGDYGTLTILRTDEVGGLQVVDRSGGWIDVDPDPDMFVVNLGDSISQWTNDRWPSTLHRVVPRPEARQSMAFFHMANWDAVIECLPTCVVPGEAARHAPVEAGPWLMRKFQATVE